MQPRSCSITRTDLTDSILHDNFHGEPPWSGTTARMVRTELASWHLLNLSRERRDALSVSQ